MTLQIGASSENFILLETMMSDVPWRGDVVPENLEIVDGFLSIPDAPRLGVELCEGEAAKYPFFPREIRHYTGALTGIRPPDACPYYRNRCAKTLLSADKTAPGIATGSEVMHRRRLFLWPEAQRPCRRQAVAGST